MVLAQQVKDMMVGILMPLIAVLVVAVLAQ
jgi:hypothetical protein